MNYKLFLTWVLIFIIVPVLTFMASFTADLPAKSAKQKDIELIKDRLDNIERKLDTILNKMDIEIDYESRAYLPTDMMEMMELINEKGN